MLIGDSTQKWITYLLGIAATGAIGAVFAALQSHFQIPVANACIEPTVGTSGAISMLLRAAISARSLS